MRFSAILLLYLFCTNVNILSGAPVSANTTNATGDYYFLYKGTNSNKEITCVNSAGCYIQCIDQEACKLATISAVSTNYLTLRCDGKYSCDELQITDGPAIEANIFCTSSLGYSCRKGNFSLANTNNINVECRSEINYQYGGGCYNLELHAANANTVTIDCDLDYDCYSSDFYLDSVSIKSTLNGKGKNSLRSANIYSANTNKLEINCYALSSCYYTNVSPPYNNPYAFSLLCMSVSSACRGVSITIPSSNSFVSNYMELICPRTNQMDYICDVGWICQDISTLSVATRTTFNSDDGNYECNDNDCCPWIDASDMVQNVTAKRSNFIPTNSVHLISPNTQDGNGQYYELTNDGIEYKAISCSNIAGCYVKCSGSNSCKSATIYAASTNYLLLECDGQYSCDSAYISQGPINKVDIFCTSRFGYSCRDAVFVVSETTIINMECDNAANYQYGGGCYDVSLWAKYATTVNIACSSYYDCYSAEFHLDFVSNKAILTANDYALSNSNIYAANANNLEIRCNALSSCYYMNVFPPYKHQYIFSLFCGAIGGSCRTVTITVPKSTSFTTNYMELDCPRTNANDYICSINFVCADISSSAATVTTFSTENAKYECNDNDCCPWTNVEAMIQSSTEREMLPNAVIPTIENGTGQYYFMTNDDNVMYKQINCNNTAGCYIQCAGSRSCDSATIYGGLTNHLTLRCDGQYACDKLYISQGPIDKIDIFCTASAGYSCRDAVFLLPDTNTVNIECDNAANYQYGGGCYDLSLWSQQSNTVSVQCSGYYDCYSAEFHIESVSNMATFTANDYGLSSSNIYASDANNLEINCNSVGACYSMTVYPPYIDENVFSLSCALQQSSCRSVAVYVANGYEADYMTLNCPDTYDSGGYNCAITWYCDEDTSTSTVTTFNSDDSQYRCNDNDCCPFSVGSATGSGSGSGSGSGNDAVYVILAIVGFVICGFVSYVAANKKKQKKNKDLNVIITSRQLSDFNKWECVSCTFQNKATDSKCSRCTQPKADMKRIEVCTEIQPVNTEMQPAPSAPSLPPQQQQYEQPPPPWAPGQQLQDDTDQIYEQQVHDKKEGNNEAVTLTQEGKNDDAVKPYDKKILNQNEINLYRRPQIESEWEQKMKQQRRENAQLQREREQREQQERDRERLEREREREEQRRREREERDRKERQRRMREEAERKKNKIIGRIRNQLPRFPNTQLMCNRCGATWRNANSAGHKARNEHVKHCRKSWNCGICGKGYDHMGWYVSHVKSCTNLQ